MTKNSVSERDLLKSIPSEWKEGYSNFRKAFDEFNWGSKLRPLHDLNRVKIINSHFFFIWKTDNWECHFSEKILTEDNNFKMYFPQLSAEQVMSKKGTPTKIKMFLSFHLENFKYKSIHDL